jgi:pimeloyl-ACP methyl ester carboxylesterase
VTIARHFVTIAGARQVHYRRAGSGPPVLLLHQSPSSSREFLPLIAELAKGYTVIAPDTPGNGLSDPLGTAATMEDYADAVVAFMDAIGLGCALVYGFHTGAACALALAHRYPHRVVAGIANGYMQLDSAERAEILTHYLPPFVPQWSGAHLLWAWARVREQFLFFPWYRRTPEARMASGLPPCEKIHAGVMDLLRAGDHYREAYRAAFAYDGSAAIREVRAKLLVMTARSDVLFPYLERIPAPSPNVRVARPPSYGDAMECLREALAAAAANTAAACEPSAAPPSQPIAGRLWSDIVSVDGCSLRALRSTEGPGLPLVACHDTTGSTLELLPVLRPLIGTRPLLAIDLPGNGESDPFSDSKHSVELQARYLERALRVLGHERVDVLAHGGGVHVAAELAAHAGSLVRGLAVWETPGPDRQSLDEAELVQYAPRLRLNEHGTHMVDAWNWVRDGLLFAPRHGRGRAEVRRPAAWQLDTDEVHARALGVLKCFDRFSELHRARARYPLEATLGGLGCPFRRFASDLDPAEVADRVLAS